MIYSTNWIKCLQKNFSWVTKMRGVMSNDKSVIMFMGRTAMDKKSYGGYCLEY